MILAGHRRLSLHELFGVSALHRRPQEPDAQGKYHQIFTHASPCLLTSKQNGADLTAWPQVLTPELFEKLKDVKSSRGYSLSNAIQAGVLRPHLGVGITCGDEESYTLFKEIIYPVVQGWHKFDPEAQQHKSDLDPSKVRALSCPSAFLTITIIAFCFLYILTV